MNRWLCSAGILALAGVVGPVVFTGCGTGRIVAGEDTSDAATGSPDAACDHLCCDPPPGGRGSPSFQCVGPGVACVLPGSDCEPLDASLDASAPLDATIGIDAARPTDASSSDASLDAVASDANVDASTGCLPACGANQVCVSTQTVGGGTERAPDAGICPPGYVLSGGACLLAPTYACAAFADSCLVFDCACAASLCPSNFQCTGTSPDQVDCVFYAP